MTKEVNLFLGETKSIEKKSSTNEAKKEGSSLFDSILANAKDGSKKTAKSESSQQKTTTDKREKSELKSTEQVTQKENIKTEKDASSESKVKNTEESKGIQESTTNEKNKTSEKKELSLLDRLVTEAKDVLKDNKSEKADIKNNKLEKEVVTVETKDVKNSTVESIKEAVKDNKSEKVDIKNNKLEKEVVKEETKDLKNSTVENIKEAIKDNKSEKVDIKNNKLEKEVVTSETKDVKKSVVESIKESIKDNKTENVDVKENSLKNEEVNTETKDAKNSIVESINESSKENKSEKVNITDSKSETKDTKNILQDNSKIVPQEVNKNDVSNRRNSSEIVTNTKENDKNLTKNNPKEPQTVSKDNLNLQIEDENLPAQTKKVDLKVADKIIKSESAEPIKNEKAAEQLAKLNSGVTNEKINVSKETLEQKIPQENKKENLSLLDKLVNESKERIKQQEVTAVSKTLPSDIKEPKNDILANIYLSSRNKNIEDKSLNAKHVGKEQALNANSVEDIKTSAKTLELGLKETQVEVKQTVEQNPSKDKNLDRLAFAKNMIHHEIQETDLKSKTISKEASKVLIEPDVNLSVSAQNTKIITQRIIGAKQQMSSMMSDLAREMYTNYKPPVTAFRLNLQPAHLGTIAIMIKSDKGSSLSISMNMSNSATLDAVTDNQSSLRSALTKSFGDENSIALDFGMQDQKENNQDNQNSNQNNQSGNQNNKNNGTTEEILDVISNNQDAEANKYM